MNSPAPPGSCRTIPTMPLRSRAALAAALRRALVPGLAALTLACASARPDGGLLHVVPKGLVHVVFTGIAEAPLQELSGREALALHEKVDAELKRTYRDEGHVAWFFHAFDEDDLFFIVARWHAGAVSGGTYEVFTRYEVRRTRRIERALGVADEIAAYERGIGQVRAGMSLAEVEAARGKPEEVVQLGPVGSFDYVYPDLCVRFLEGRAAHLWAPDRCRP